MSGKSQLGDSDQNEEVYDQIVTEDTETTRSRFLFHPSEKTPQQYVSPITIPQTRSIAVLSVAIVGSAAATTVTAVVLTLAPASVMSVVTEYLPIGLLPRAVVAPIIMSLSALAALQMIVVAGRVIFPVDVTQLLAAVGICAGLGAIVGIELITAALATPVFTTQIAQTQMTAVGAGVVTAVTGLFAVALSMHTPYIPSGTTYQSAKYDPTEPTSYDGSPPREDGVSASMSETFVCDTRASFNRTDPVLTQLRHSNTVRVLPATEDTVSESDKQQPTSPDSTTQRSATETDQSTSSVTDQSTETQSRDPADTETGVDEQLNLTDMDTKSNTPDESSSTDDTEASDTVDPYADLDLRDTDPVFSDVANADPADTEDNTPEQTATDSPVETDPETDMDGEEADIDFTELDYDWTRDTDVTFSDVGGMDDLKAEIRRDIIEPFTTKRKQAKKLGIPVPNVLFHGPPGTGKTYFAQAIASELNLPFVKLSGGDVTSKWINASAGKVATLFTEATTVADACNGAVIFLDEIDSVLKDRSSNSHEEDHKVVNEFLNRLEDISNIESDILFIGATNRYDRLDTAGVRTGRIDKEIEIGKPDQEAREAVFAAQLNDRPHNLTADMIRQAASYTDGYVPADIEGIVTDAARRALHAGDGVIQPKNLEDAIVDASPSVASDPD